MKTLLVAALLLAACGGSVSTGSGKCTCKNPCTDGIYYWSDEAPREFPGFEEPEPTTPPGPPQKHKCHTDHNGREHCPRG